MTDETAGLRRSLEAANDMCMSAYGCTASEVLEENARLAAEHAQVHAVNVGLLRDLSDLRKRFAAENRAANHWFKEANDEHNRLEKLRARNDALATDAVGLLAQAYDMLHHTMFAGPNGTVLHPHPDCPACRWQAACFHLSWQLAALECDHE